MRKKLRKSMGINYVFVFYTLYETIKSVSFAVTVHTQLSLEAITMSISTFFQSAVGSALPMFPPNSKTRQLSRSGDIYAVPSTINPLDRFNLLIGRHEAEELALLEQFRPSKCIIELGANFGFVARQAFPKLQEGGLYVCVEPRPDVQEALTYNMMETGRRYSERGFHVIAAAVGDPKNDGKKVDFALRPNLCSSTFNPDLSNRHFARLSAKQKVISLPSISLSKILQTIVPEGQTVSLICDIEGGEKILCETDAVALKRINQIAIEFHGPDVTGFAETADDLLAAYTALGFRSKMNVKDGLCHLLTRTPA